MTPGATLLPAAFSTLASGLSSPAGPAMSSATAAPVSVGGLVVNPKEAPPWLWIGAAAVAGFVLARGIR